MSTPSTPRRRPAAAVGQQQQQQQQQVPPVVSNGTKSTTTSGSPAVRYSPLPAAVRYYCYGVQGFCDEIVFTAVFDYLVLGDRRLRGHSAISSFFIYGTCSFMVERLYTWLWYKKRVPRLARMALYTAIAFGWEFTTGLILRQFNACPWDYSHYRFNFMGLITMEYAPGWFLLAYGQDVLADFLLRVHTVPTVQLEDQDQDHQD